MHPVLVTLALLYAGGFGYTVAFLQAAMYIRRGHLPLSVRTLSSWQMWLAYGFFALFWPVTMSYIFVDSDPESK